MSRCQQQGVIKANVVVLGSYPKQASHPPPTMPDIPADPESASLGCSSKYPNPSDASTGSCTPRPVKDQHPTAEPVAPQRPGRSSSRSWAMTAPGDAFETSARRYGRAVIAPSRGGPGTQCVLGSLARLARTRSAPTQAQQLVSSANTSGLAGAVGQRRSSKVIPRSRSRATATTVGATAR